MSTRVTIIGKGAFGLLAGEILAPHAQVSFIEAGSTKKERAELLAQAVYVIFAVPISSLEEAILQNKPYIQSKSCIVDVTSVKQAPLALLESHFPKHEVIGTHPIFGPQSVADNQGSTQGLPIVLCRSSSSDTHYSVIYNFCTHTLDCRVIEQTPAEHDHEMAHVQGLAHFIGRALARLDIQDYATSTHSYHQLVKLKQLLEHDSWELFETIQNTNPEAEEVRTRFTEELHTLEQELRKQK